MNRSSYLLLLLALTTTAFLAGSWGSRHAAAGNPSTAGRRILYYTDPMHPSYKSDKPGIAPDCGMQLEPVYADGGPSGGSRDGGMPSELQGEHQGDVKIDGSEQQLSGIGVGVVEKVSGEYPIRLFGRVTADEARTYKVNAGADGYIEQVSAVTTGSRVKRDQLLATFSTPMATMAIQTYLLNLGTQDDVQSAGKDSLEAQSNPAVRASLQQRVQQLHNLGMSDLQMAEMKHTREFPASIQIVSPADGVVLARNISPGQKFDRGAEWYRIADLSKVWVMADVFAGDDQYLHPGTRARVSLPSHKGSFPAVVGEVLPEFDANSRTLKVRLEIDNPDYTLRPDMFVDVELLVAFSDVIAVPLDAILDSGLKKTVFVDRGEGNFESREVETGRRFAGRVEIVAGLKPGERIASTGTFMLDSESRMRQTGMAVQDAMTNDPVCGMRLSAAQAGAQMEYQGVMRYFCSKGCKEKFANNPRQYVGNLSVARPGKTTD
jgi:Cu(I)/Ag(I) efflux system membrane fusion protein